MGVLKHARIRPISSNSSLKTLTDEEIEDFVNDLDVDKNGNISFAEIEQRLAAVLEELAPEPQEHHLNHPTRRSQEILSRSHSSIDLEKGDTKQHPEHNGLHAFLCYLLPECAPTIPKDDFKQRVRSWNVPSQQQNSAEDHDEKAADYTYKLSLQRRLRAYWSSKGPKILFVGFVIALILACGIWQLIEYINEPETRAAMGRGVIMAKGFAGVLYPTLFFMLLSMSRWFATGCRRFYHLSRFVNWDRHQSFHIWMACLGLFAATMHAIGHLTGTFLYSTRPEHQEALVRLLGPGRAPRSYMDFVASRSGWTGVLALGLFWTIALLSAPYIRKWSYELFQSAHLLMFPMIGLLAAHGTAKLLQYPMMGFILAFPALLVIAERLHRLYRGFVRVSAVLDILDTDTITITCKHPQGKSWHYSAGQFVLLQVPALSLFQWHPFTISHCAGDVLQLHIKTEGDWTRKLRNLPREITVGIDGPFGAPAQRFYEYDRSLIIGAGVGVTPFSAIISDLEQNILDESGWSKRQSRRISWNLSPNRSSRASNVTSLSSSSRPDSPDATSERSVSTAIKTLSSKRVDFHWLVREKNSLLWFSDLLNRAHDMSRALPPGSLDLNIHTHITLKRKNISAHIFSFLLDVYRTESCPVSALTGLKMRSNFGRPEFERILDDFHESTRKAIDLGISSKGEKVAVFFCGPPAIGAVLSDLCRELTLKGKADGTNIRWDFRMEVFG